MRKHNTGTQSWGEQQQSQSEADGRNRSGRSEQPLLHIRRAGRACSGGESAGGALWHSRVRTAKDAMDTSSIRRKAIIS
jgi:hypothetical protein